MLLFKKSGYFCNEAKLCRADLESETSYIEWVKRRILVQHDQLFGTFKSGSDFKV